ncbi:HET-domain-containing protein, partial [Hyaloscypha hepaticicola]
PTRVLDVSAGDNHNLVRLVSGADVQGVYATLNHCWGNLPVQTCCRASISELRRNVPWESLCKTFQDAILVARGLSIKYLWIDSLCIIQDDNDDCQREIGNMACIYSNGCVNIAAAASVNGSGGCFANYRRYMTPWELEWGPLTKRGWVVQERILAKRIVYYGEDQLYWDCAEGRESECGIDVSFYGSKDLGSNGGFRMLKASIEHGDEEVWERVVELYTRCDLTKPNDKLPALSGIAMTYAAVTGMTYIAGLWKERLPCQLLWTVARSPQSTHLSFYRAPSFSWASIDGAVSF